jgi:DNA-binding Lrp family transcriptional regulator
MENKQSAKVASSYALVKIGDRDKLVPAMEKLYLNEHVLYCDAVDGDYDLALLLQGAANAEIDAFVAKQIKSISGVENVEVCQIVEPEEGSTGAAPALRGAGMDRYDATKAQSYVFIEVEKEHFDKVYRTLTALDSVAVCDITRGKFTLVLLVRAAGFDLIRKLIAAKIRPLPGVLRIKQSHIIRMFEM